MPYMMQEFMTRLAVMVPTMLVIAAGLWGLAAVFRMLRREAPRNLYDMRTWPLSYALGYAGVFATVFAAVVAFVDAGDDAADLATLVAAFVAIHAMPFIVAMRG